jgi:hypothetical protein
MTFEQEIRNFFAGLPEDFGEDTHVFTQEEWRKRGEAYGNNAPFVITTEGPFYDIYNYGTLPETRDRFDAIAAKHGYYFEPAYAWMIIPVKS